MLGLNSVWENWDVVEIAISTHEEELEESYPDFHASLCESCPGEASTPWYFQAAHHGQGSQKPESLSQEAD